MMISYKVKNHSKVKEKLIKSLLDSDGKTSGSVQKTDWELKNPNKLYMDIFKPILEEHLRYLLKKIYGAHKNKITATVNNIWYQIYTETSQHSWHTHAFTQLANVYYVELPSKDYITKFLNVKNITAQEGCIITFPSWYLHRASVIKNNQRKIVIAYNVDMENIC